MCIFSVVAHTFLPLIMVRVREVKAFLGLLKTDTMSAAVVCRLGIVRIRDRTDKLRRRLLILYLDMYKLGSLWLTPCLKAFSTSGTNNNGAILKSVSFTLLVNCTSTCLGRRIFIRLT